MLTAPDVMNMSGPKKRVDTRAEMARRAIEAKKEAQERVAANVGLTVEEYCDYYGLKEVRTPPLRRALRGAAPALLLHSC